MKYRILFLPLLLCVTNLLQAQDEFDEATKKMDSLRLALSALPEDSSRFAVLEDLAYTAIYSMDAETYVKYTEDYLALAKELNSHRHLSYVYGRMVHNITFVDLELYEKYITEGEQYLKQKKDTLGLIKLILSKSLYAREDLLDNASAIKYLEEALELCQKTNCKNDRHKIYLYFAKVMFVIQDYDYTITYANRIITASETSSLQKADALKIKGLSYANLEKLDSAKSFFHQALVLSAAESDLLNVQYLSSYLGDIYLSENLIDTAKLYYQRAEFLALNSGEQLTVLPSSYESIGLYHKEKGQLDSAILYFNKSISQAEQESGYNSVALVNQRETHLNLSEIYEKKNELDSALYHRKQYSIYQDSVLQITARKAAEEFNTIYETTEKEATINTLNTDNQELLSNNQLLASRNQAYLIAIFGIALSALISLFSFLNSRRKNRLINKQKIRLEELNLTKDRLFAIIGHDMRKPVLAFRGIGKKVNYLIQKQDYKTLSALGDGIEKDAMALNKLTDNLLNWALMQKNVLPYNPELIDLVSLVEETIAIFQKASKDKNISLIPSIVKGIKVYADRNTLLTIVRNLVDNAIKFTAENGRVEIIAVAENDNIKLQVKDNGTGISPEKLKDIFLLKEDKSEEGTGGEEGTGLGLHLVHELVELNRGAINVISKLNEGSSFEINLPATKLA